MKTKTKLNNSISSIVQNEKNDINKWNNEEANYYDNGQIRMNKLIKIFFTLNHSLCGQDTIHIKHFQ